jgi:predicted Rossmann-fold nucleotide-binding protein
MGVGRNILVVRTADALIAMPGSTGTLSEIALALNLGKPVVDLGGWKIEGTVEAADPQEAVQLAIDMAARKDAS